MQKKIKEYVNENKMLNKCHRVVVGLSGGADSVCLLVIMKELCNELGMELIAVHINHGIRGAEADRDEEFCVKLCVELSIELIVKKYDVPAYAKENGLSEEEAGRILRYETFREIAGENGVIAVAHHRNDQAETVIFNLVRGTKLKGTAGMEPVRGRVIRPLLDVTKQEIEDFLRENNIKYCTDSTNMSNDYARNLIRNEIIPLLIGINDGAVDHIGDYAKSVLETERFLEEITCDKYLKCSKVSGNRILLDIGIESPYLAKRLIRKALGDMNNGLKDITDTHISEIINLSKGKIGGHKHIKSGICVENTRDGLLFYLEKDVVRPVLMEVIPPTEIFVKNLMGKMNFSIIKEFDNKKITNQDYTKWLDYDKIKFGLQLRGWQSGDVISIENGHHKKLKDYFVDEHMSRVQKAETLLLADGNNIVWVIGGRIGSDYKITESTKRVLEIRYIGGNHGEN